MNSQRNWGAAVFISFLLGCFAWAEEVIVTAIRNPSTQPEGSFSVEIDGRDYVGRLTSSGAMLESTLGVYVSRSQSSEKEEMLTLRGFSGHQVKVLVDGVPLGLRGGDPADLASIPTSIIKKIVVTRGSMSGLYGSGAMGGVVNIITKKNLKQSSVSLLQGSFNTRKINTQFFHSSKSLKTSFVGYLNSQSGDYSYKNRKNSYYYDGHEAEELVIKNNQSDETGGTLNLISLKRKFPITLTAQYYQKKRGLPGKITQSFERISEAVEQTKFQVAMQPVPIGRGKFSGSIYQMGSERNYNDSEGEYNGFPERHRTSGKTLGMLSSYQRLLTSRIMNKSEIELSKSTFTSEQLERQRNSTRLTSSFEFSFAGDQLNLTPYASFNRASELSNMAAWGLSSKYQLSSHFALKSNLGTGFRYPTFEELYLSRGMFVGNPDLKSERSFGGDVGMEYKVRRWRVGLAYFAYETKDQIEYLLVSGFQYKPFNFRQTLTEGVEFGVAYKRPARWAVESNLTAQNVLNRDEEGDYYNRKVPNKPTLHGRQKWSLLLIKDVEFFSEWIFAFERFVNRSNTKQLKNRVLNHLGVRYGNPAALLFSFEVKNIFDEYNIDLRGFPLPERSFYASLAYSI